MSIKWNSLPKNRNNQVFKKKINVVMLTLVWPDTQLGVRLSHEHSWEKQDYEKQLKLRGLGW